MGAPPLRARQHHRRAQRHQKPLGSASWSARARNHPQKWISPCERSAGRLLIGSRQGRHPPAIGAAMSLLQPILRTIWVRMMPCLRRTVHGPSPASRPTGCARPDVDLPTSHSTGAPPARSGSISRPIAHTRSRESTCQVVRLCLSSRTGGRSRSRTAVRSPLRGYHLPSIMRNQWVTLFCSLC